MTTRPLEGLDFIREKVRIRDNHTCQKCFKRWTPGTRRFDVHHLDIKEEGDKGREYSKNTNFKKLITFCHKCHLNLHTVKQKIFKAQVLKRYGTATSYHHRFDSVLDYRMKRMTFEEIGQLLSVTRQRAHQMYQVAIRASA
jgi:hypothetical protein